MKITIDPNGEPVIVTTITGLTDTHRHQICVRTDFECDSILSVEPLPRSRRTFGVNAEKTQTTVQAQVDGEQLDFGFQFG